MKDKKQLTEIVEKSLKSVALWDEVKDRLNSTALALSGGQQQRVAIARALLNDPSFLLMDEPFGALDALTRDELNIELQRIWNETKKTVMFITHSIAEAVFLADRVAVMKKDPGEIVEILEIDIPRPRRLAIRETPEFSVYAQRIREIFEQLGVYKEKV